MFRFITRPIYKSFHQNYLILHLKKNFINKKNIFLHGKKPPDLKLFYLFF
jgi:hypothetical protein